MSQHPPPVFVVGSGRSGNTLMRRIIMSGREIYLPPETYVLRSVIKAWRRSPFLSWLEKVQMVCGYFLTSEDAHAFPTNDFRPVVKQARELPTKQQSLAEILHLIYRHLAEAADMQSARLWGDKTPMNTSSLELIRSVFPQGKFLIMHRDPFDTCASILAMGRYDSLEDSARRWRDANEACLSFNKKRRANSQLVSYEDLVREPEKIAKRVCEFIGIGFTTDMLSPPTGLNFGDIELYDHLRNASHEINAKSIGRGKATLSLGDIEAITAIALPTMQKLGYQV